MKKYLIILLVLIACSPDDTLSTTEETVQKESVIEETVQEESVIEETVQEESVIEETVQEESVIEETQDTPARDFRYSRGVLRYSPSQHIPLVMKAEETYTEAEIIPEHKYIEYFFYNVRFPQFKEEIACSEKINIRIVNIMNKFINDQKSVLAYYTPEDAEEDDMPYSEQLSVYYDIVEVSELVVSLIITHQSYSFGAAHPITYPVSLNFDLSNCDEINISELFNNDTAYEEALRNEMQLQLCSPLYEKLCEEYNLEEIKPLAELENCCSVFAVSEYGLFVQFWEYEVSGYAQGAELILIPWGGLVEFLDINTPYADILKNYSEKSWIVTPYEPEWDF